MSTKVEKENNKVAEMPKFPIEALRKKCNEVFGVPSFVFDGATYGKTGEYSVDEIKSVINSWLKKEVK